MHKLLANGFNQLYGQYLPPKLLNLPPKCFHSSFLCSLVLLKSLNTMKLSKTMPTTIAES